MNFWHLRSKDLTYELRVSADAGQEKASKVAGISHPPGLSVEMLSLSAAQPPSPLSNQASTCQASGSTGPDPQATPILSCRRVSGGRGQGLHHDFIFQVCRQFEPRLVCCKRGTATPCHAASSHGVNDKYYSDSALILFEISSVSLPFPGGVAGPKLCRSKSHSIVERDVPARFPVE